ncbi:MAG TPA: C45 family peptidase [Longimicrobium sp.]|jgi:predicted choloylglycine hydrolase|uniref:C45 family peptidase n=1 Tax=Longimicrobium sp. TaxID=2029185 RepID=UPI002EDA83EC
MPPAAVGRAPGPSPTSPAAAPRPPLALAGSPYEIGREHGRLLGGEIGAFLADRHARVNLLRRTPLHGRALTRRVRPFLEQIERHLPDVAEELHGLAAGAAIPIESATLLQVRRELIGYVPFPSGECSTLAQARPGRGPFIAQTIDLNGGVSSLGALLRVEQRTARGAPDYVMYTLSGLLGFAGMNDAGVAVGINLVLAGRWRPGIPPYLLVRHLLNQTSVEACIDELARLPRSSSRALTLCDAHRVVTVEMTVDQHRVLEGGPMLHTNHFLHPDLVPADRMNPFSRRSSRDRLQLLRERLPATDTDAPAEVFGLLADHSLYPVGICAHADGNVRREETVAALLMEPAMGVFHAVLGQPCTAPVTRVQLPRAAARSARPHPIGAPPLAALPPSSASNR